MRNRSKGCIPSEDLNSGNSSIFSRHQDPALVLLLTSNGGFRFVWWCRVVSREEVRPTHDIFSCHMDGFSVAMSGA